MGKKKVIDFLEYQQKLKKCPRIKIRSQRTDNYLKITKDKIYDVENDSPNSTRNDFLILNDKGDLVQVPKDYFKILNEGQPVIDNVETPPVDNNENQTTLHSA